MKTRIWNGALLTGLALAIGAAGGYWFARPQLAADSNLTNAQIAPVHDEREVLYWYDPMYPQQKFEQPGQSPFMDMALVPRYASDTSDSAAVNIDPRIVQNLGMRLATVTREHLSSELEVTGSLTFNNRDVAVVQARSGGFVERVYRRAPEDLLTAGAPLADLLVPDWAAVQEEFLALRDVGDKALLAAARQRLRLSGMPQLLIERVERSGQVQALWTVTSPVGGVLLELNVREGMTLVAGQSLATLNGLSSVWLDVAVPEAEAGGITLGQPVEAYLPAFPGEVLVGKVGAFLPQANLDSRTLRVRVELDNPTGRLRPGMTAKVRLNRPSEQSALYVPNEAVIRTGRRALVMLVEGEGRYRPVEVRLGREGTAKAEIVEGLKEGQQVVASGQFLLDSEASLRGVLALGLASPDAPPMQTLHEAEGKVLKIDNGSVTLAHGPFKTLGMPGMTMGFPLAESALKVDIKEGDTVRVGVRETDDGLLIERLQKLEVQP